MRYEVVLFDDAADTEVIIGPNDIYAGYDSTLGKLIVLRFKKARG